jgi:single-stranded-DNA-specific exonuclease
VDDAIWRLIPPREEAKTLASELGIPLPIAQVLLNRKIDGPGAVDRFLNGTLRHLHDPFLMSGMKEAVDRVSQAIERRERILIFGDYDVDGVLSVVMLHEALKAMKADVDYFIPDRLKEGYGIKDEHIGVAAERGARLVISVDCGIKAIGFVRTAKDLGIDVIITDHHRPGPELPAALAVLDPVLPDCGYPDKKLAGVGVVFKFIQALFKKKGREGLLEPYLKPAAIGTISDIAELKGENRLLVKYGLEGLGDVRNIGLRSLIDICRLQRKKITEGDIGFRIGPRINAAGRMGMADLAVRLFLSKDKVETALIARRLDGLNATRQAAEDRIYRQAFEQITASGLDRTYRILILGCAEWHRGVIGIVASRLKDAFCRPVILFSYEEEKAFGSGRSTEEFSLIDCLDECRSLFVSYGGHPYAVGCTLPRDRLPALKEAANAFAGARITDEQMKRKIVIDARLDFSEATDGFLENLSLLAPFGVGNPRPVFLTEGAEIIAEPQTLQGRHAKFIVRQGSRTFEALGWERGGWAERFHKKDRIDLAFTLQSSSYLGEEKSYLSLEGVKT